MLPYEQLQRVEQEAEEARKTLGLQTEEDKKRAQFADELERKRHVDQVQSMQHAVRGLSCCPGRVSLVSCMAVVFRRKRLG